MIPIKNPPTIPQAEIPLLIDCNQLNFDGDAIDFRTDIPGVHPFCHSMLSINQGKFVSQSPGGYKEIPISDYMVPNTYLVFTELVNSNPLFVEAFQKSVMDKLNGPAWRKAYNWLQIFGQALGLPWISFPGLDDCSMDVIFHLKEASNALPYADNQIIQGISNHCNPEQFAYIKIGNPSVFNIKYFYSN
jgi:hypothetical protein